MLALVLYLVVQSGMKEGALNACFVQKGGIFLGALATAGIDDGRTVDTTVSNLRPIFDAKDADNEYGVVFLNFTGTEDFKDPWGTPYRLTFDSVRSTGSQDRNKTAFETTVALPVRETLNP